LVKIADRCGPKALLAPMVARSRGGDPVFVRVLVCNCKLRIFKVFI